MVLQWWDYCLNKTVLDSACLFTDSGVHWYNLSDLNRADPDIHKETHIQISQLFPSYSLQGLSGRVMWNGICSGVDQRDFEMENKRIPQAILEKSWQSLEPGWRSGEG